MASSNQRSLVFSNGDTYVGRTKNKLPHGIGKYTSKYGYTYTGTFACGKRHGFGKWTMESQRMQQRWENIRHKFMHTSVLKNQLKSYLQIVASLMIYYEGEWENGVENGKGIARFVNGDTFEGDYIGSKIHDSGKWKFSTGGFYRGEWEEGLPHGNGTLICLQSKIKIEGRFRNGNPCFGSREAVISPLDVLSKVGFGFKGNQEDNVHASTASRSEERVKNSFGSSKLQSNTSYIKFHGMPVPVRVNAIKNVETDLRLLFILFPTASRLEESDNNGIDEYKTRSKPFENEQRFQCIVYSGGSVYLGSCRNSRPHGIGIMLEYQSVCERLIPKRDIKKINRKDARTLVNIYIGFFEYGVRSGKGVAVYGTDILTLEFIIKLGDENGSQKSPEISSYPLQCGFLKSNDGRRVHWLSDTVHESIERKKNVLNFVSSNKADLNIQPKKFLETLINEFLQETDSLEEGKLPPEDFTKHVSSPVIARIVFFSLFMLNSCLEVGLFSRGKLETESKGYLRICAHHIKP